MDDSTSPAHVGSHSREYSGNSTGMETAGGMISHHNETENSQNSQGQRNESEFLLAMESIESHARPRLDDSPAQQTSSPGQDLSLKHPSSSSAKDQNSIAADPSHHANLSRASVTSVYSLTPLRSDDFSNLDESVGEQGSFPDSIGEYCPSHELDFSGISLGEKKCEGGGKEVKDVVSEMDLSDISLAECKKLLVQSAELLSLERREK
eukprot:766926-Hanusia_phi.AAC.1